MSFSDPKKRTASIYICINDKISINMRKLKLQMQLSVDGFVARPDGALDWMTWTMDDKLKQFIHSLTDSSDTILLGRKMTEGFVSHWENVVNNKPGSPEFSLAKKMVDTP